MTDAKVIHRVRAALKNLESCIDARTDKCGNFWACEGPGKRPVHMKTCCRCRGLWETRQRLRRLLKDLTTPPAGPRFTTVDGIHRLPSGKYSKPCWNCGKRHQSEFSDDFEWCPACRAECEHDPDKDCPTTCSICAADLSAVA